MAQVFLSYDRADAAKARSIAHALEKAGHSVWWDRHIKGGTQYSKAIEAALKSAEAIVVLWSRHSIDSPWVRDEAAMGRDTQRLVPALIEPIEPPLGFRQYQTVDLTTWKGRATSSEFREALAAIASLGAQPAEALPSGNPKSSKLTRRSVAAFIGLAIAVAAVLAWQAWSARSSAPVIAISPASQSSFARTLAEDLFVGLGAAQAGRIGSVELVRDDGRERANLILEVAGSPSSASLVLLRPQDRQLLFSQELETPNASAGRLEQSVQVAAAAALECAANALTSREQLPLETLKDYLQACAQFSSYYGTEEAYIPLGQLEQVVKREGRFVPAWRQLLLAGKFMRAVPTDNAKPSDQWLRTMIERAKQVDPAMPELGLAELELLPMVDFANRLKITGQLRSAHPDDLFVLTSRAEHLMQVGQNNEAVEEAERAARLHPLAPYSRSEYVRALAFSGRLERAFEELESFAVLEDVARNLTETRFRINLRYGDPRSSLAIFRRYGTSQMHEAFLLARIDQTEANRQRAIGLARAAAAQRGHYASFAEVLLEFGREDEAFETLMRVPVQRVDQFLLQTLFRPTLSRLRADPRFLKIAHRYGLLDYWRKSGEWPDFCSEPGLPYDCKAEAAKLN